MMFVGEEAPPGPKGKVFEVRLRCVTVDTIEVAGESEADAVEAAITAFEKRSPSDHDCVESLSVEARMVCAEPAVREE